MDSTLSALLNLSLVPAIADTYDTVPKPFRERVLHRNVKSRLPVLLLITYERTEGSWPNAELNASITTEVFRHLYEVCGCAVQSC